MLYALLISLSDRASGFNVFRFITFRVALAVLTCLGLSLFLGPIVIRFLQSHQIGEEIRDDGPQTHLSKKGTPTMGGLLILFTVIVSVLLWSDLTIRFVWLVLFVLVSYGVLGFADDYTKVILKNKKGIPPLRKLLLQGALGLVAGYLLYSGIAEPSYQPVVMFPFFKNVNPDIGIWFIPYAALVIVAKSNAMGDVGALPLGAALAAIALSIKQEILLFLVGGLFVLEMLSVILQVVSFKVRGKRIFRMAPLHHHYEEKGWSEPKVTVRFWIVAIMLALLSLSTLKLR